MKEYVKENMIKLWINEWNIYSLGEGDRGKGWGFQQHSHSHFS